MLNFIKSILKKNKFIWSHILKLRNKFELYKLFRYDFQQYYKYSVANANGNVKEIELEIIVISHIIEKGLAHKNFRTSFAKVKVEELSKLIKKYYENEIYDEFILKMGIDALQQYYSKNLSYDVDVSEFCYWPKIDNTLEETYVGVKQYTVKEIFRNSNSNFYDFATSRYSVRPFESMGIGLEPELLDKVINLALTAPSACNRQSTRVHVINNKDLIAKVAKIQSGSKGFGENSDVLIVITSDLSLYSSSDRRLPYIDSGIFTMNFIYSLFHFEIASCILNASLPINDEITVKKLIGIPENEVIATFISTFKLNENEMYNVGIAKRHSSSSITRWVK